MVFADMGGFTLLYDGQRLREQLRHDTQSIWSKLFGRRRRGAQQQDLELHESDGGGGGAFLLSAKSLRTAIEGNHLDTAPQVTEEELMDKSKNDIFTKVLTSWQATYFVVQVLVRVRRGLRVSQLELGATSYVACSVVTYMFTLYKPQSVMTVTVLARLKGRVPPEIRDAAGTRGPFDNAWLKAVYGHDRRAKLENPQETAEAALVPLISIFFGAFHLAGWNLVFPTVIDLWVWRAAALTSVAVLPFAIVVLFVIPPVIRYDSWKVTACVALGLYGMARLLLIAEMFRCLFYLTPEPFVTTWTTYIPHIG
ncbi:hypothetical protein LTR65_009841 [Meristemomyces frigidus]